MEQSANENAVRARATRREWIGLAVLLLAALVYAMDLTVLNLAIPRISAELQPSSAQLLWILDIYGFLVAGLLITMGTLGDRIGRRKLLLGGAAGFALASLLAAFSTTPPCALIVPLSCANASARSRCIRSGPRRTVASVEPTTSMNRLVTSRSSLCAFTTRIVVPRERRITAIG